MNYKILLRTTALVINKPEIIQYPIGHIKRTNPDLFTLLSMHVKSSLKRPYKPFCSLYTVVIRKVML